MKPAAILEMKLSVKDLLILMNNLCDMERKLQLHGDPGNALRNIDRIKEAFQDVGIFYEDPLGQSFNETRTDLEATITGDGTDILKVVEVIKPIIRAGDPTYSKVIQKGIVIVQSEQGQE
jgi:hypothetical protein